MSKFRVIAQSPITLNLRNGKTISAKKGMVVEPTQDHFFLSALKQRLLVPHRPPPAAPVPVSAPPAVPAPVVESAPVVSEPAVEVVEPPVADEAPAPAAEVAPAVEVVAVEPSAEEVVAEDEPEPVQLSVHDLGLSARTVTALVAGGYETAQALASATDEELVAINGIGETTVKTIRAQLAAHGF